jgi:hypothetical protein
MRPNSLTPTSCPAHTGREHVPAPARACGRRAHHTRRYVTTLIHMAWMTDASALPRLQLRARKHAHGSALGLIALARTLTSPAQRRQASICATASAV